MQGKIDELLDSLQHEHQASSWPRKNSGALRERGRPRA
jgi:hypothetical protein